MSLLRFCYAGRQKKLAFTSSITSCLGPGGNSPTIFEAPVGNEPSAALSTGYAQSKYISKFRVASSCLHIHMANCSQPFSTKQSKELLKQLRSPTPSKFLSVSCASASSAARFELACGVRPRCIRFYSQPHSTLVCTVSLLLPVGAWTGSPSTSRRIAFLSFSSRKNLPRGKQKENKNRRKKVRI